MVFTLLSGPMVYTLFPCFETPYYKQYLMESLPVAQNTLNGDRQVLDPSFEIGRTGLESPLKPSFALPTIALHKKRWPQDPYPM